MEYLTFEFSDGVDGIATLDAMASTTAEEHPAVLAEVHAVLDWAQREFPNGPGPVDEGHDWDHDLQLGVEDGGWHVLSLTFSATPRFVEAFRLAFGPHED